VLVLYGVLWSVFRGRMIGGGEGGERQRIQVRSDCDWRRLLNAELRNLYSSTNIIRVIQSRG